MNCIMGNDTEAHDKIAGNNDLMQDTTASINGIALEQNCTADHFVTSTSPFKCTRWVGSTP